MKRNNFFLILFAVALFIGFNTKVHAQTSPVLYFCESYDDSRGEINISDRFHTGYLTVMVKATDPLGLTDCSIQFDRYNTRTGEFEYYKKFNYTVSPSMKYIYFSRNSESDMSFDKTGIYRVFLLDARDRTVTSGLIEIIP